MIRRALTEADAEQFRLIYPALFRMPVDRAGNSLSGNVGEPTPRGRLTPSSASNPNTTPQRKLKISRYRRSGRPGERAVVNSAGPHHGEEDCLRGWRGSGTIFFSRCNLRCVYCQNWEISWQGQGQEASGEELAQMMLRLQTLGCHNVNLVTPSHVVAQILAAVTIAAERGLRLPYAWNGGVYRSLSQVAKAITGTSWNGHRFFGLKAVRNGASSRRRSAAPRPNPSLDTGMPTLAAFAPVSADRSPPLATKESEFDVSERVRLGDRAARAGQRSVRSAASGQAISLQAGYEGIRRSQASPSSAAHVWPRSDWLRSMWQSEVLQPYKILMPSWSNPH